MQNELELEMGYPSIKTIYILIKKILHYIISLSYKLEYNDCRRLLCTYISSN